MIETIKPDGWSQKMRYDSDNNPTSSLDGNGNRTNRVFDARGRLIREIDPFQKVTTFEYDSANQMIAQIDSTGHKKHFKYDALGRQISLIDAPNTPISGT